MTMNESNNSETSLAWIVVLVQSILCIVLVTYFIGLSFSNHVSYIKSTSESASKFTQLSAPTTDVLENGIEGLRVTQEHQNILKSQRNLTQSKLSYRMDEEGAKKQSSEYTRRGMLWSRHASWHLPLAPRSDITSVDNQGLEHILSLLKKYDVDPIRGFLPSQDPLQRLPYARYHLWEDLGDDLPKLLGARLGQARDPLRQLPVLMTDKLTTDDELRRAHLLLCLFAHAYVWGGNEPMDHIPEGIAKPLWEVSQRLGIAPILGHPSIVLYNWRRLDIDADISMENLTTLNNFFDGRDESWFYLITVEVEARGAAAVLPMMLAIDAIQRYNEEKDHLDALEAENELKQQPKSRHESFGNDEGLFSGQSNSSGSNLFSNLSSTATQPPQQSSVSTKPFATMLMRRNRPISSRNNSNIVSGLIGGTGNTSTSLDSDYRRNLWGYDETELDEAEEDASRFNRALIGELVLTRVARYVTHQLNKVAAAIKGTCLSIESMREGCHPFIFYHRVRPFLSGWKDNPILPDGVIYQGVNNDVPMKFFGGSAAQSALLPFLDICLGISHSNTKSQEFLLVMRQYMNRIHREFLEYIQTVACLRQFVDSHVQPESEAESTAATGGSRAEQGMPHDEEREDNLFSPISPFPIKPRVTRHRRETALDEETRNLLRDTYNDCIVNLQRFRSSHINIVAEYIIAQQRLGSTSALDLNNPTVKNTQESVSKDSDRTDDNPNDVATKSNSVNKGLSNSAGGKGTGGTELMSFLKPIRDNVRDSMFPEDGSETAAAESAQADQGDLKAPLRAFSYVSNQSNSQSHRLPPLTTPPVAAQLNLDLDAPADVAGAGSTAALSSEPYHKDNAGIEDIDLYRGAAPVPRSMSSSVQDKPFVYRQPSHTKEESWRIT